VTDALGLYLRLRIDPVTFAIARDMENTVIGIHWDSEIGSSHAV
jgi:hypothetical protein